MSIPISPNKTIPWKDPDEPVTYHFRYLTGDRLEDYLRDSRVFTPDPTPFMAQALKEVKAQTKGSRLKKGELESKTQARASALAYEVSEAALNPLRYARFVVDTFVARWEGKDLSLIHI